MNVLLINKFFYPKGGAEKSFFDTASLLREAGHGVSFFSMSHPLNLESPDSRFFVSTVDYDAPGPLFRKIRGAARLLYSTEARKKLSERLRSTKPDVVHLHNIHHQISPSILPLLKESRIPVVMTLHDYKMVCPVYTLFQNGRICEKCGHGKYLHCLTGRCAKSSYAKSCLNMLEMFLHRTVLRLYSLIDVCISPSLFLKNKLEELGFPGPIVHLPNFIQSRAFESIPGGTEGRILYFGRLSPEKGLRTLLDAAGTSRLAWVIVGDGPEKNRLAKAIRDRALTNVSLLGYKPVEALREEIRNSMFTVLPSIWYENQPYSVMESFALGKPVIASAIGGIPELVRDGRTGWTFRPGDSADLAEKAARLAGNPERIREMGREARRLVESDFSPADHYRKLMGIYGMAARRTR